MEIGELATLVEHLPEVTCSTSYGTDALKVRGTMFCRLWGAREHARDGVEDSAVLVVFCDPEEKPQLLAGYPGVVFQTPHYEGHRTVLLKLDQIDRNLLVSFLEDSYQQKAPASLRRQIADPSG